MKKCPSSDCCQNKNKPSSSDFEKEMNLDGVTPLPSSDRNFNKKKTKATPGQEQRKKDAETEKLMNYLRDYLEKDSLVCPDTVFDWRRDGTQKKVAEHFRKGRYQSGCQIDLHGRTIKEAHALIWKFLQDAIVNGNRNVTIIHGRGVRSTPQAQMKSYVGQILKEHDKVHGFCSAPSEEGGSGATWVWLRKSGDDRLENAERHQGRRG